MSQARAWLRTPDARWLLVVFAVAFVIRLLVAINITPDPRDGRYDDSVWYDTTAQHLAAGDGYVFDPTVWLAPNGDRIYPNETELTPTALWPPGYPITLAAIYKLTDDSVAAGRFANVVFGSLTAVLVFAIARKLFGDLLPAVFSGLAIAVLPSHVLFTSVLLSETYFGFLLALILFVSVYFVFDREKPNLPIVFGLGLLVAATGYVRGEFIAFGGVLALLMIFHWRRRALLPLVAFAIGAALVVTPWTIRNRSSMGETIIGTTGAGRVLYQGHNERTDGGPSLQAFWYLEQDYAGLDRKTIELEANKDGTRLAKDYAKDHKVHELQLVGRRMFLLFRNDESGVTWIQSNKLWFDEENANKLIALSSFVFWGLTALALASIPIWWRWRDTKRWAVFAIAPYYMVVFGVLFIGDPRYHYAMYIPITTFAGVGLAAAARMTAANWRDVAGGRSLGSVLRTYGSPER
ncbi:MAG TPA: glycosyltransferase family 39 protein [Dehalococcoidia bacterium]